MRYPFRHHAQKFLDANRHSYTKATYAERSRRLRQIGEGAEALWRDGKITTTDPSKMLSGDVREIFGAMQARGLSGKALANEIRCLARLCRYCKNPCVDDACRAYPDMAVSISSAQKAGIIPADAVAEIIARGLAKNDLRALLPYAAVTVSICAGLSTSEIINVRRAGLDADGGTIETGEKLRGSYLHPRVVPILPIGIPLLRKYAILRDADGPPSEYLFAGPAGDHYAASTLKRYKEEVATAIGHNISFAAGRRTYLYLLIKADVPLTNVYAHGGIRHPGEGRGIEARQREIDFVRSTRRTLEEKVIRHD